MTDAGECSEGDKVDALFVIVRGCAAASACSARTPTRPSFVDMLTVRPRLA